MGEDSGTCSAPIHALKILFITLEFRSGTFSGNGVYATAQVRALAAAGHNVFVISAAPAHTKPSHNASEVVKIYEVPVSSWHRLDAGAPWQEFAAGASEEQLGEMVRAFAPDVVLAVDWSSHEAVRNLLPYCGSAPFVYLNYRVFTRTATGSDLDLIRGLESAAMSKALITVALSRSDAEYLATKVAEAEAAGGAAAAPAGGRDPNGATPGAGTQSQENAVQEEGAVQQVLEPPPPPPPPPPAAAAAVSRILRLPKVLLPALREDVRQLEPPAELLLLLERDKQVSEPHGSCDTASMADMAAAWAQSRPYLSCVVRLSPEKEPERFVALVEAMAAQGLLERCQLTPLLLGVANDGYAQGLKARLRAAAPSSVILESFMGPKELAAVYRKTRLNFHPSTYDAYGMTIVEAASQGAPSIVHDGDGAVGATDLMRGSAGEVFLLNLTSPVEQLALAVSGVLEHSASLAMTSARAMQRARSWDEAANAEELVRFVREAMTQCPAH